MTSARIRTSSRHKVDGRLTLVALALALGLASCNDGSTGPQGEGQDAIEIFSGLNVSDIIGASGGGGLAAASTGVAYVSACPSTFEDVVEVTITNLANGESVTVSVADGGFDPVALEAEPGDELEFVLRHADGSTSTHSTEVPARRRPRVVRTEPPKDATQVVLSASVVIIFSEPIDEASVTTVNIRLETEGGSVAGAVELAEDGLTAEFTPVEPLAEGTWYTIVVTTGVQDSDGDALEQDTKVNFMTQGQAQVSLCAKQSVIERINWIEEPWPDTVVGWTGPEVSSTGLRCGVRDGEYYPHGTFTYNTSGSRLEWEFEGEGFVTWDHYYALILYPDGPWPGRNLHCLAGTGGGFTAARGPDPARGTVSISGSYEFHADVKGGRIWIVRADWVDCTGVEWWHMWHNPDHLVPRLTNDLNDDGVADATASTIYCYPDCEWGDDMANWTLVFDYVFEADVNSLIYFDDTNLESDGGGR